MIEKYKKIEGFENYEISNFGNVRKKGKILKQRIDKERPVINLIKNGKPIAKRICVLVAVAFLPNPNNFSKVRNKNGDKSENYVDNLEWNNIDGVVFDKNKNGSSGIKNGRAKITETQVLEIRKSNLKQKELSKIYGIRQSTISLIKSNELWSHI